MTDINRLHQIHARSIEALERGDFGLAESLLRQLLPHAPEDAGLLSNLGMALRRQRKFHAAVPVYRALRKIEPRQHDHLYHLGLSLLNAGDAKGATDAFAHLSRSMPDDDDIRIKYARALKASARDREAERLLRSLLDSPPRDPAVRRNLAFGLSEVGDLDGARDLLSDLVDEPSVGGEVLHKLTELDVPLDGRFIDRAGRALAEGGDWEQRAHAGYALAKALEKGGDDDGAFEALVRANACVRECVEAPTDDYDKVVDRIVALFDGAFLENHAEAPSTPDGAIFVTGLPRSSTSLVARILDVHPLVTDLGELNALWNGLAAVSGETAFEAGLWSRLDPAALDWTAVRKSYLGAIPPSPTERFVDKALNAAEMTGVMAAALPGAVMVECHRHPLDTAIGCYRQYFGAQHEYTYDLESLGRYMLAHHRLVEAWTERLPGRFRNLFHERLVANPEGDIPRLLESCGLPPSERCLSHHTFKGGVSTLSGVQVQKPVNREGVERWKRYAHRPEVKALADRLGPVIEWYEAAVEDG